MRLLDGLVSILALIAGFPAIAAPLADTQKELSSYMEARVRANDFSGAVLVKLGGERLLLRGYGLANREWAIPNTPTTRFRLGSLTKGFTATLIMQLNGRGRIDLNAGICSYLSSCPQAWRPVTVHQLLTHTGGIPSLTDDAEFVAEGHDTLRRSPEQLIALIRDRPLEFVPGSD
jgi:CubicO group peptidase (beta-lactamase class C family)